MSDQVAAATPRLVLDKVVRSFAQGGKRLDVLRGASLTIGAGELVAIVGPSGAGKSTLLHIAGLLERPDGGLVTIDGNACNGMRDNALTELRRRTVGFVYQFHHLLPEFSAVENVELPARMCSSGSWMSKRAAVRARAESLLDQVGLADRRDARPATLSGGEKQRVAIARALINEPKILLCDEPTGNLDKKTSQEIYDLLGRIHKATMYSAVIVTHETELAGWCDRILTLEDGILCGK